MPRAAFEQKLVVQARDLRSLIARRNRLEHQRDELAGKAKAIAMEIASLAVQIEEARAAVALVAVSDD
jgi:uncharacterized protein (UPF0335 family)